MQRPCPRCRAVVDVGGDEACPSCGARPSALVRKMSSWSTDARRQRGRLAAGMALASIASVVAMILSSRVRWHEGTFAFGLASLASISAGFFLLMARGIEATSRPESARVALYVLALLGSLAAGIAAVLAVLHAMEGPLW